MVSVVKYFRRNHFQKKKNSRKYFPAFGSHKKITKGENATVVGIRQRPVAVVGFRQARLAGSGQNCRTPPDPVKSCQILAILVKSGWISGRIHPNPAGSRPFWPDSVGSMAGSGQIWPDSGNRISNVYARTKSLILENDLRFLKL
jgi:hypothetical protein